MSVLPHEIYQRDKANMRLQHQQYRMRPTPEEKADVGGIPDWIQSAIHAPAYVPLFVAQPENRPRSLSQSSNISKSSAGSSGPRKWSISDILGTNDENKNPSNTEQADKTNPLLRPSNSSLVSSSSMPSLASIAISLGQPGADARSMNSRKWSFGSQDSSNIWAYDASQAIPLRDVSSSESPPTQSVEERKSSVSPPAQPTIRPICPRIEPPPANLDLRQRQVEQTKTKTFSLNPNAQVYNSARISDEIGDFEQEVEEVEEKGECRFVPQHFDPDADRIQHSWRGPSNPSQLRTDEYSYRGASSVGSVHSHHSHNSYTSRRSGHSSYGSQSLHNSYNHQQMAPMHPQVHHQHHHILTTPSIANSVSSHSSGGTHTSSVRSHPHSHRGAPTSHEYLQRNVQPSRHHPRSRHTVSTGTRSVRSATASVRSQTMSVASHSSGGSNGTRPSVLPNGAAVPVEGPPKNLTEVIERKLVRTFAYQQLGSRYLQTALKRASPNDLRGAFDQIYADIIPLSDNVFGNYVIQKFLEHGSPRQRCEIVYKLRGHFARLCSSTYGCRVVQKILEFADMDTKLVVLDELVPHIDELVRDDNGNHVVQKVIRELPWTHLGAVHECIQRDLRKYCTHMFGCRVVQRLLEQDNGHFIESVVPIVMNDLLELCQDAWGNYVVQHLLENGPSQVQTQIIDQISSKTASLSRHKFASNVVEKAFTFGGLQQKKELLMVLMKSSERELLDVVCDQFGNYVVQKALEIEAEPERSKFMRLLRSFAHILQENPNGLRVMHKIQHIESGDADTTS